MMLFGWIRHRLNGSAALVATPIKQEIDSETERLSSAVENLSQKGVAEVKIVRALNREAMDKLFDDTLRALEKKDVYK